MYIRNTSPNTKYMEKQIIFIKQSVNAIVSKGYAKCGTIVNWNLACTVNEK